MANKILTSSLKEIGDSKVLSTCKNYFRRMARTPNIATNNNFTDQTSINKEEIGGLKRVLSIFQLTMIGISSTIGAGIYVLTGTVARDVAGPGVVLSYLIAGIASFFSALCYCELSSIYPKGGSAYSYVYLSMGEAVGFVIGWNIILEYVVGSAAIVKSFISYVTYLFNQIHLVNMNLTLNDTFINSSIHGENVISSQKFDFLSLALCFFITIFVIFYGIQKYSMLNTFGTIINLVSIIIITIIGCFYINTKNWSNFAPYGYNGIMSGASICFFSYIGFDVVASLGDEAKNPSRSIPVSIFLTIVICIILYISVSSILTLIVPYYSLKGSAAFAEAFLQNNNRYATWLVSIGASFGLLACVFSSLLPSPRIIYTMAKDGLLFKPLTYVSESTSVPVVSTIVGGLLSGLLALFLSVDELVEMMSIGTLLAYCSVCIGVIVIRIKQNTRSKQLSDSCNCLYKKAVYILLAFIVISSFVISTIIVHEGHIMRFTLYNFEIKKNYLVIFLCAFLVVKLTLWLMLFKIMSVYQKITSAENNVKLTFTVPFVPFIPMMGMFVNIFLMVSLRKLTWIRFFVWLIIGEAIYFLYGINHSVLECINKK